MTRRVIVRIAGAVLLLVVAACGSADVARTPVSSGPVPAGRWTGQVLKGQPGPDHPVQLAVDGDRTVIAFTSDEGVITGYAADAKGRFRAGSPTATGMRFLGLGGVTRHGDGWLAVGSGGERDRKELLFDVKAFGSADGRTWSEVNTTGLDGPADVSGIVAVEGGVVAFGTMRDAEDPASGGFRPVAWHSADGKRWASVRLPTGSGKEGSVGAVVVTGDELLAVGGLDRKGVMWSSTDDGVSWRLVERDGVPPTTDLRGIAIQDKTLVVSGSKPSSNEGTGEGAQVLLRSTDGGRHWRKAAHPPPPNWGEPFPFPLFSGGGRFFTLTTSSIESVAQPEICYADIELCRQDSSVALYVSDDGDRWRRVDSSGIGEGEAGEVASIIATEERIVALNRVEGGIATWTWPGDRPLPTGVEPLDPTSDVELLGENEVPELGRRYGVPLYTHCGMDWLYVGGKAWRRTDKGPDVETGAGEGFPDDWPVAQQSIFGFATLVRDDLIEYSIGDGEVIATYGPPTEPPPGCM